MRSHFIGLCGDINDSLDICRKLEVLYRVYYLRIPRCLSGGTCNINEALEKYEFYRTIHSVAPPPDPRSQYENKKKLYIIGNLEPDEHEKVEACGGKLVKRPEVYMGFIAPVIDQFDTED
ncbi:unnamed protein product [Sphagnum jensenii]|uniref:BRCT domain-containing protein n=1 Tax=Sphagnum jensenii TaxID=128206 RepID=A0ABP0VBI7_9BRYO